MARVNLTDLVACVHVADACSRCDKWFSDGEVVYMDPEKMDSEKAVCYECMHEVVVQGQASKHERKGKRPSREEVKK